MNASSACGRGERITRESLTVRVIVRRVARGAAPFAWEVHRTDMERLVHASPARFGSMDAAYMAGAARLVDFIQKRSAPPGLRAVSADWSGEA
jgi:hypothetical protein